MAAWWLRLPRPPDRWLSQSGPVARMFLTSLAGAVRVAPVIDLAVGKVERRLRCELRQIGLIVLSEGPDLVVFATPTVTDGKTWWWMAWGLFATVSGGSFGLGDIAHNVVTYSLSIRRLLFVSIFVELFVLLILVPSIIAQHDAFLLLIPIGFSLFAYFGNRFVLWVRIRRWLRRVVARPIEADSAGMTPSG